MSKGILFLVVLVLTGCASKPFVQFYQDRTDGIDLTKSPVVVFPNGKPKLLRGADIEADYQQMIENGYNLVGFSSFNGEDVNVDGALIQAKVVHAEIVLMYSNYTGTRSGMLPLTLPDIQTSTTRICTGVAATGVSRDQRILRRMVRKLHISPIVSTGTIILHRTG